MACAPGNGVHPVIPPIPPIEHLLGISPSGQVKGKQKCRDQVGRFLIGVFRKRAPGIYQLEEGASFDDGMRRAVHGDIEQAAHALEQGTLPAEFTGETLPAPNHFRRLAHKAIYDLIDYGHSRGLWAHPPWEAYLAIPKVPRKPSRRTARRIEHAHKMRDALNTKLVDELPTNEKCVSGLILLSSALNGALITPFFLTQVVHPEITPLKYRNFVWLDLSTTKDISDKSQYVRRWLPDPVSLHLLNRWQRRINYRHHPPKTDAALEAACAWLGVRTITLQQLAAMAGALWASHLPAWMITYLLDPSWGQSLPHDAWTRLITGKRLQIKSQACKPDSMHEISSRSDDAMLSEQRTPAFDGPTLKRAVRELERCLRSTRKAVLRPAEITERLDVWHKTFGGLGGWVTLLSAWVRATKFASVRPKKGAQQVGITPSTMLRYLVGFGQPFIVQFRELPPSAAREEPEAVEACMTRLSHALAGQKRVDLAKLGLTQFLRFVSIQGGPTIRLNDDMRNLMSEVRIKCNFLTPGEYERALAILSSMLPAESYLSMRARVMTTLYFRLGLRRKECSDLQLGDLHIESIDGHIKGRLDIRDNAFSRKKSRSSIRCIPLELFLSRTELEFLLEYQSTARSLNGRAKFRPITDALFADVGNLQLPPEAGGTVNLILHAIRESSGDGRLVIHSLRHSAASLTLIRACGDAHIDLHEQIPEFRKVQSGLIAPLARHATQRKHDDPSSLYILSALLGHLDPTVSMKHYVHTAELVVWPTVHDASKLPAPMEAKLRGISAKSVARGRERHHQRRKNTA